MKLTFTTGITVLVVRLLNTNAAVEIVEHAAFIELPILAWQWLLTALININKNRPRDRPLFIAPVLYDR